MTAHRVGPWPRQREGLTFREATDADVEVLVSFRNDPA